MSNNNLHAARNAKNDEFYTMLTDIEKEMKHYKTKFKNKVLFLNCDDPRASNFWKYFSANFEHLGLKKLISTHYKVKGMAYKLEITRDVNGDGKINDLDTIKTPLSGDGDFRSPECVAILKEANIVVTNPPFSLFREYIALLVEHKKKFIVVGSQNAITYKETFKLIKDDKLWVGNTLAKQFLTPEGTIQKFGNIGWFTNVNFKRRNDDITLCKKYKGNKSDYPKYDNYNAINVDKVADIPMDYTGAMGVPITFLNKHNPEQFEIVSSNDYRNNKDVPFKEHGLIKDKDGTINGIAKFVRIVIKRK